MGKNTIFVILGAIILFFSIFNDCSTAGRSKNRSIHNDCIRRYTISPHRFSRVNVTQLPIREEVAPLSSPTNVPLALLVNFVENIEEYKTIAVNLEQAAEYLINYKFLKLHSQSKGAESEQTRFRSLGEQVIILHPIPSVQEDIEKDIKDLNKIISISMRAALYVQKAFELKNWNEGTYERVKYNFITAERGFRWLNHEKTDFIIDDNLIDKQIRILGDAIPQIVKSLSWEQDKIICLKTTFKFLPEARS